jgi:CubicO group peptidase (beta-lactamase class C family)
MRVACTVAIGALAAAVIAGAAIGSGSTAVPGSVLAASPPAPSYWPTTGWRVASPASQGMDARQLGAMLARIRSANLPVDSVTVIRHGYVVLDRRFGRYASATLGQPYASGRLHELQSVTKSVTSMLLGIALQGRPASGISVKTPVLKLAAARHYVPKNTDARKRGMTIEDLLTMQSGLAWKESGYAYTAASGNDVEAMFKTGNWTNYVIDRPMAAQPGTTFNYDSGTAHLVSGVVTILTGRTAEAFAATRLFGPLGIHRHSWLTAPEGTSAGGFGLALQPRDLAKLAFLFLHHGRWDGRQIVPAGWVEESTTDHVADPRHDYGYLWWLDDSNGYAYMAGLYGQLAVVDPGKDLVVVITSHFPATVDATDVTRSLLATYILPAAH